MLFVSVPESLAYPDACLVVNIVTFSHSGKLSVSVNLSAESNTLLRKRMSGNLLYFTLLYCTALYCTVLYCTILGRTVLYYTILHSKCTVLH